jgi:outer membrane immunogenic protein
MGLLAIARQSCTFETHKRSKNWGSAMGRKGYLLATAGSVAAVGATGTAQAAPPAPPPAPIWTGWYVGLNAGMHWQHSSDSTTGGYSPLADQTSAPGFIGGGQMGYNWQTGNVVFGLEGDIDGLTGTAGGSNLVGLPFGNTKGFFTNSIHWLSTIRGRVGLAAGDNFAYVTGGAAFGGVNNAFHAAPGFLSKSESKTQTGWAAGVGAEHMLMNSHWIVGFEVLYVDLGRSSIFTSPGKTTRFSNTTAITRFKLDYKF